MKRSFPHRLFPALAACLLTIALAAPPVRAADASAGAGGNAPASEQGKAAAKPAAEQSKAAPEAAGKPTPAQGKAAPRSAGKAAPKTDAKAAPKTDAKAAPKTDAKAAPKGKAKPAAKAGSAAPAKSPAAPAAGKKTAPRPAPAAGKSADEIMHQKLEEFGRDIIEKMNKHALPSQGKKEVIKNKDGSYTARYVSFDPASLRVSFKKAEPPTGAVSHIGYMHYRSREFFCTASTAEAAEKGTFEPRTSRGHTELIKYVRGKWSY